MKTCTRALLAALAALPLGLFAVTSATAHFQLIYTQETQIGKPGDVPVKLIFWHPFENGHVMDMGRPLAFFAVHRGKKIDLMDTLRETTFTGSGNSAIAYDASVPVKRSGDYILAVTPAPYLEKSEDVYIQQITKAYLNRSTLPTDWTTPLGLKTEIIPLNKPTNVIAGSTFSGRVMADGKPVAGAEIEIEYMAAEPDMATNTAKAPVAGPMPGGSVVALADDNGYFTFGIPKAGYWGFAALGSGPDTEYEGKKLSQDAVIWIRAYDVK
ncbi:MAG: DUF4198 domain-containing protein [Hyphomicrobiales bacterium]|nr:MAG: DUF4198 domain-containing protein [Hyphomicrobiales bacterium]